MAFHLGIKGVKKIYLGETPIKNIYLGTHKIFSGEDNYLRFTAEEANSTFGVSVTGSPVGHIEYSVDNGSTWTNLTGNTVTLANIGDYALIKGVGGAVSNDSSNYTNFVMSGKIAATGDISTVSDIGPYCYYKLFKDCASLTSAPELLSTTLASGCYYSIFNNCTSLLLPPTELPATTLADHCYRLMFAGCSSLIESPIIRATTFGNESMTSMFNTCSSISQITVNFTSWPSSTVTAAWVKNTPATGDFYCPSTLSDERGDNKIPSGWTKIDL